MRTAYAYYMVRSVNVADPVLGDLSWSERTIIRRVRAQWTKEDLSVASGVSGVTLWRVLECKDPDRREEPTERVRLMIDAALDRREAQLSSAATA